MINEDLNQNIDKFINSIGKKSPVITKKFYIGKDKNMKAAIIFVDDLADKNIIDKNLLNPLINFVNEDLSVIQNLPEYITEMHIPIASTTIQYDINKAIDNVKRGKTVLLIDRYEQFIIIDTSDGKIRAITEPENEAVLRGPRDGFLENLNINISMIRRRIKDNNLIIEYFKVGRRSQTDLAILYIDDIADNSIINELKEKISAIDVDYVSATGALEQYIDKYDYNIFPQFNGTERVDKVEADLMEGKIAIILDGTPYVITAPSIFIEFFQAPEDYYQRTVASSLIRILRFFAACIVITLGPFYLTLVKANNEFIPLKFIIPIAQAREGISLSIFIEILSMELVIEFLREGGLRLPSKIAQTMSLVGGIIIGDTAVRSKIVSSTTLFVIGVSTICTFVIVNYDMSLAIRTLRFPMLVLSYFLGIFGIAVGWYLIMFYLCTLDNFGVPYFSFKKGDTNDSFIRKPLWKFNNRVESIPHKDNVRQSDFRDKIRGNNDE